MLNRQCPPFLRLLQGGTALADRCHCAIFVHERIGRFYSENTWNIGEVYSHPPSGLDSTLNLEVELVKNGFENTLKTGDGRHIGWLVEEKLEHPRHRAMINRFGESGQLSYDEMLALICYTGTEVYSDLRRSAAARNWDRWPSFTSHLTSALRTLQKLEMRDTEPSLPLFHGIANATPEGQHGGGDRGFWLKFMMPISTSTDRGVALSFAEFGSDQRSTNSLLLRFESPFREERLGKSMTYFADISWVSKFPSEREVLVFPVGDCMGGQLIDSFKHYNCNVKEFRHLSNSS
jgi:hypothetical protein